MNSLINPFIESVDCSFDNKKFFVILKEYIIFGHIGQIDELIIDNLIIPYYPNHLQYFIDIIFKFFSDF